MNEPSQEVPRALKISAFFLNKPKLDAEKLNFKEIFNHDLLLEVPLPLNQLSSTFHLNLSAG